MIIRRPMLFSLVTVALLAIWTIAPAHAVVVFGNLGASGTNGATNTNTDIGSTASATSGPQYLAQGFTASGPNLTVESISLWLYSAAGASANVSLYADNAGVPAASPLFTSSALTITGTAKALWSFPFAGATLASGSNYWIVPSSTDVSWYTGFSNLSQQNSSGYQWTTTLENVDNAGWNDPGIYRYTVSVVAVPEPPALVLSGIGVASAVYFLRRRRG